MDFKSLEDKIKKYNSKEINREEFEGEFSRFEKEYIRKFFFCFILILYKMRKELPLNLTENLNVLFEGYYDEDSMKIFKENLIKSYLNHLNNNLIS